MKTVQKQPPAIRHVTLKAVSRLTRSERSRLTLVAEVALLVLDLNRRQGSILAMYQAGQGGEQKAGGRGYAPG